MNTLSRRNPFAEFGDMFDTMEKTFDAIWRNNQGASTVGFVPIDIYEKEDAFYIRAAVPGLMEEDLDLTVEKNVLTLRGEIRNGWESEGTKVYRREGAYGRFTRSIRLPENVDVEQTDAGFERGVLTIRVPKADTRRNQALRIPIRQSISNEPPALEANASEATPEPNA